MKSKVYRRSPDEVFIFERPVHSTELLELAKEILDERMQREDAFTSSNLSRMYVKAELKNEEREVFCCLFLDNQNRLISFERLFYGTIDGARVHPREVVKACLKVNAAAVIMAHNHPSGVAEPSQADISITNRIKNVLSEVDVRVLDHLIVGDPECTSLAERGLI